MNALFVIRELGNGGVYMSSERLKSMQRKDEGRQMMKNETKGRGRNAQAKVKNSQSRSPRGIYSPTVAHINTIFLIGTYTFFCAKTKRGRRVCD